MKTLKELLKPPFKYDLSNCKLKLNNSGKKYLTIQCADKNDRNLIVGFVEQALNEKWERQFGDPKHWLEESNGFISVVYRCPECNKNNVLDTMYCPSCGQRLFPPEEPT